MESVWIDPTHKRCVINVDLFVNNTTSVEQPLSVIHRGGLFGEDATAEAWGGFGAPSSWPHSVADRLMSLHCDFDPIDSISPEFVRLAGVDYSLWKGPGGALNVVVGSQDRDVPFTMWEIGPFPAKSRSLARLQLTLSVESYRKQVGPLSEFYAYGDAILLDLIRREDLPGYCREDLADYEAALGSFRSHLVPGIFEWLMVTPEDDPLRWQTTPLSHNLSPRIIRDRFRDSTHWFVADYNLAREFHLKGKPSNAFVLKVAAVTRVSVGANC